VAKANYHQIRRQKELARKTRKQEKQQKRQALKAGEPNAAEPESSELPTPDSTAAEPVDTHPQSRASADQPVADSTNSAGGPGPLSS
jgi:hypothetical protein